MTMWDNIMEFKDRSDYETDDEFFQLNVFGTVMNFQLHKKYYYPVAYFHPCDKESVIEAMHYYFLDFFGDTVEYQYIGNYKKFVPHLPKLSLCLCFWTGKSIGDIKPIEEYLASSPVLKNISMELDAPELFSPDSKFYQAESITLALYTRTLSAFLCRFQGRQAILHCNTWDILDIIEFMNRWKSGEGSRKLEYLNIGKIPNDIHRNEFLNALGVKHIDESTTPPTHTLPKVFKIGFGPNTDPIISHSYVVRESDNRVASVSIQKKSFCFGVWNKTEEEFLRMAK
ncbi:hypothetical protein B9Z55_009630 [Caenorhabditis nigoni]|nr:hypothetical protein B9Z55_009630 [Caenorhabditis nigoni]